jgi:hypothetical protein
VAAAGHVEVPPPPSSTRGMVWGPPPVFMVVKGWRGPLQEPTPEADPVALGSGGAVPLLRGRARRNPCPQGETRRSFPLGFRHGWAHSHGVRQGGGPTLGGRSGWSSALKGWLGS